ncbi:hypothetical protein [Natrialba asiatica]|uniref:DUF5518 domain-containing protein n=1 Tax=Natrialba asiatica (strain ATCC 700177 / DSM 12278 / JCM 9576 / FERM P-10747 / NBRC 102637 / 172P1) TaxID=29540 RepID=M0AZH7_NATA1|nr:hypothetical protein [Natrialba asiatica]ELZ02844.1 hypothetical protein C481_06557 [Natrialba asiatica DSM 12278]
MSEDNSSTATAPAIRMELDTKILLAAVIVGVLVDLTALLVPLLGRLGGGVVAGFVAAYATGRIVSGLIHAILASSLVGIAAGTVTGTLGTVLGLYNEPPLLVFGSIGPVSPMVSGLGFPSIVLLALLFSLLTVADGVLGGVVGGGLRTLLPR